MEPQTDLDKLIFSWLEHQYFWNTILERRSVDYVISKNFNTVDFYFTEFEDEQFYIDLCKEKYKEWCKENFDSLKENDKKNKITEETWEEYFEKRKDYPTFITELFITSTMLDKLKEGKNPKRVKREFR